MYREKDGLIILEGSDLYKNKEGKVTLKPNKIIGKDENFFNEVQEKTRQAYKSK